jgi:hypothetical protein
MPFQTSLPSWSNEALKARTWDDCTSDPQKALTELNLLLHQCQLWSPNQSQIYFTGSRCWVTFWGRYEIPRPQLFFLSQYQHHTGFLTQFSVLTPALFWPGAWPTILAWPPRTQFPPSSASGSCRYFSPQRLDPCQWTPNYSWEPWISPSQDRAPQGHCSVSLLAYAFLVPSLSCILLRTGL